MFTRTHNVASTRPTAAAPAIESLEDRRLMSATVLFGALIVTGTDGPDTISLSMDAQHSNKLDVTINDKLAGSFNLNRIKLGVHVLGLGGDDTIYVDESNGIIPFGIDMIGGAGNDVLFGGTGNDTFFGGPGDDLLFGNDGNDLLDGGDGNDLAAGGFGNDLLIGGRGDDMLIGDLGRDRLYGNDGTDALDGGDDDDYLNGGAGNDVLLGGYGADTFAKSDDASEIVDLSVEDVVG